MASAAEVVVESQAEPYNLIDVTTPDKGTGYAWFVMGPRGMERWVATGPNNQSIAFTGPPGKYTVMLVVQISGGGLDQGFADVVIGGDAPNPDPPPPPPPSELAAVVIVIESSQQTPEQARVILSTAWRKYLTGQKIKFRVTDPNVLDQTGSVPSDLKPAITAAEETEGPDVCFVYSDDSVTCEPLPETLPAMLELLEMYGGE
jgi:hypothetical protein